MARALIVAHTSYEQAQHATNSRCLTRANECSIMLLPVAIVSQMCTDTA